MAFLFAMQPHKSAQALALLAFLIHGVISGTTLDDALLLWQKGDFPSGRTALEKAYAENPADPTITLLYAQSLVDATQALALYKKIVQDKSAADSLRAEAYFRLGCASYIKGRFQKASGYFKKAAGAGGNAMYREACYLNAVHDTLDTFFMQTMQKEAQDTVLPPGKMANFYLGVFYYGKKDFTGALSHFDVSLDPGDSLPWTCSAYAGTYCCAAILSRPEYASAALGHIKRVYPSFLEKTMVSKAKTATIVRVQKDTAAAAHPASDSAVTSVKKPHVEKNTVRKTVFSLQVGAFGSIDNAESVKANLSAKFSPVSVVTGTSGEKTIYRVRVGAFETKESAQAFGDSSLVKKGLKFRVVEETE